MRIQTAEFIGSAVSPNQYPSEFLPEVALVGRSNVGKSSLINRLTNRKALAKTSSKPGKTQTLNFYRMNQNFFLVDVPGYGYAKVSKQQRAHWDKMVKSYLAQRKKLTLVCVVVDFRHKPMPLDVAMVNFLADLDLPFRIILTKVDKVKKNQQASQFQLVKQTFAIPDDECYYRFSAMTGQGMEALTDLFEAAISEGD